MARLQWKVLKTFGVLPNEARAREMLDREFLWCGLHLLLDEEERLSRLCPSCRSQAESPHCPSCGTPTCDMGCGMNTGFDLERFERMKRGESVC